MVDLLKAYTIRVGQTSFAGIDMTTWLWEHARTIGAVLTVVAIGAVIVLGLRGHGPQRGLVLVAIVASFAIYVVSFGITVPLETLVLVNTRNGGVDLTYAGRYAVIAGLLLLLAFIPAWSAILAAAAGILRGVLIGCTVALVALYAVAVYQAYGVRIEAPDALAWSVSTAEARQECANPAVPTVDVPIYPQGWVLSLSCDELRSRPTGQSLSIRVRLMVKLTMNTCSPVDDQHHAPDRQPHRRQRVQRSETLRSPADHRDDERGHAEPADQHADHHAALEGDPLQRALQPLTARQQPQVRRVGPGDHGQPEVWIPATTAVAQASMVCTLNATLPICCGPKDSHSSPATTDDQQHQRRVPAAASAG